MARNWKKLNQKYKIRRVVLVTILIVLILSIGWLLGSKTGSIHVGQNDESLTLGDSDIDSALVSSELSVESSVVSVPPRTNQSENWETILVNTSNPLEETFSVELDQVTGEFFLDSRIVPILKKMIVQAKSEGINLQIFAAYRDPAEQNIFHNQKTEEFLKKGLDIDKAQEEASKTVPEAGKSEYHTGLATEISSPEIGIDNSFDQTAGFKWLEENAAEHGFVLRYPQNKESITHMNYSACHFRYVGVEVAKIMKENNYTLEEYLYMEERNKNKEFLTSETEESVESEQDGE